MKSIDNESVIKDEHDGNEIGNQLTIQNFDFVILVFGILMVISLVSFVAQLI
ncbi:MAG: hypothetical protein QM535_22250 [Limnohabitans sp.]|nr:hypothetical protein [Limnohabitans sp.]